MKQSINWHLECLANWESSFKRQALEVDRAKESKVTHMFNGQPGANICGNCVKHAKKRIEESNEQ